jgi:hypothetical protein
MTPGSVPNGSLRRRDFADDAVSVDFIGGLLKMEIIMGDHQISTGRIRFIPMKSYAVLPSLDIGGKLDFGLIDGSHTFPQPIIDYHYLNENLKVGGLLVLDDLKLDRRRATSHSLRLASSSLRLELLAEDTQISAQTIRR